jgi:uncharacterized protein YjbI with pentapeptide repeats
VTRDTNSAELEDQQRANAVNSARTTLVQGLVGLAALAGIFVAWQQLQTDRGQLTEQLTLTRQGQAADRFTRAIDQLGSDKLEQRLGGIYGLELIAKESPDGGTRRVVTEVLTTYVRQHAAADPKTSAKRPPVDKLSERAPDLQAIMTVLGRRTSAATDPPLDFSGVDLSGVNLVGADLPRVHFDEAQLQGAEFDGAQLQDASFVGADLAGAVFDDAQLQRAIFATAQLKNVNFNSAQLQDAHFADAEMRGVALSSAQAQGAIFANARLQGVLLENAQLQGAILNGAQLQRAILDGAQLQWAGLTDAQLQQAKCTGETRWPVGFDWKAAGVELHLEGQTQDQP